MEPFTAAASARRQARLQNAKAQLAILRDLPAAKLDRYERWVVDALVRRCPEGWQLMSLQRLRVSCGLIAQASMLPIPRAAYDEE